MKEFPESEYQLPFFKEYGYIRKKCPKCGEYFWTLNPDQPTCGESTSAGCAPYAFIGNSPTRRKYNVREMREAFLSFFERHGHERIKPYPIVARWRDDLYFTHASIIDFQPYVTEGIIPPPANPLVICQPCLRFVDVDNVGPTFGRHLTIFEMGGHHAFNYPDKEIYWKDQTVRYHHEFVTEILGVSAERVIYKEGVWIGGGNAGPDVETIIDGLEVATLVFMNYKVVNGEFVKLPIRTVDTGYGIERYTWLSSGAISGFHAVYGSVLDKIFSMAGITNLDEKLLGEVSKYSGMLSLEKVANRLNARKAIAEKVGMEVEELDRLLSPVESVFAVADHTKALAFMLAEGVVPSNVREGYLARLMIRRTYRLLRFLGIEERLPEIVDLQIQYWSPDFPYLKDMRDKILEILDVEREKYRQTLQRGENLIRRIVKELKNKGKGTIPTETLVELYDSHGLPPEIVKEIAEKESVKAEVPDNFYNIVAERHVQAPVGIKDKFTAEMEAKVEGLPETRKLYYEDQYMRSFKAKVLKIIDNKYIVLDQTAFYPEGGGQPADKGILKFENGKCEVVNVQKIGNVIIHEAKGETLPAEGTMVEGEIDWDRRYSLMKAHTATHIIMGAARRVLGEHVWQAGTQKGVETSRLNISHYKRLTFDEVKKIEELANQVIHHNIPVEIKWMTRTEAEKLYGFRLYQGGAVPGKEIRVVKIGDWEVEACGGTHVKNTGEIGFIKIVHTERVQDGVERLDYSIGIQALKAIQQKEELLLKTAEILETPIEKLPKTAKKILEELKETRRRERQLLKELAEKETGVLAVAEETVEVEGVKLVKRRFDDTNIERMIQTASQTIKKEPKAVALFYASDEKAARIVVMAGKKAIEKGVNAGEIAKVAASAIGGGGGGRPDFAQGGGTKPQNLEKAIEEAEKILKKQLKG